MDRSWGRRDRRDFVGRRDFLSGMGLAGVGAALSFGALDRCSVDVRTRAPSSPVPASGHPSSTLAFQVPPIRARLDRITSITVCTRPFRAQGPRLDVERIGNKTVVHNYGHGGSGWSLSWGSSSIAVAKALGTGEREVAVIGCGALGLTSALLLQRVGARVTIYAKDLPPTSAPRWPLDCGRQTRASASRNTRPRLSSSSGQAWRASRF